MHSPNDGFVEVALLSALAPGSTKEVQANSHWVLLVRDTDGTLYATQADCSHQGKPLDGGRVWQGILTCPWHYFQWYLATGENRYPKNVYPLDMRPDLRRQVRPLRTYQVRARDGMIEVRVPGPPPSARG